VTAAEPAVAGELDVDVAAPSAYLEHERGDLNGARERFMRVHADALHIEPVAAGEPGELVTTTLTKGLLPLVRYRTADTGAVDDVLILGGVNVYPYEIEHVLLGIEGSRRTTS
jgi:phenylacetate-CoA ligase